MSMFTLTSSAIDEQCLKDQVRQKEAGGFVSFEGWVRNHNEGREVESLEYEAYESLALKEGDCIIHEALERYEIYAALCEHRIGHLQLTDIAVWVGVSAAHRGPAFEASQYIINEIKIRLPIWKKEHYTDGDSGWVNCEECSKHQH
ncbi:MAG: molybdenum cofactor biosynthesis protein MoaE [Lentisphaeria bacterium]|nr:molybdenum cofactor biosynthesis protein MoaE [Lentisphaeria bacterium]